MSLSRPLSQRSTASLSASVIFLAACGLESRPLATVQVVIPPIAEPKPVVEDSRDAPRGLIAAPPASISGFDCIAVNIMASDILPRDPDPNDPSHAQILQDFKTKNYCSYPGVTSSVYRLIPGQTNVLEVPNVPTSDGRIVELIGIKLAPGQTTCPASLVDKDGESDQNTEHLRPRYYYIGSKKGVSVGRDTTSVTITNEYSSISPKIFASVECGRVPIYVVPTQASCSSGMPPSTISTYQSYIFGLRASDGPATSNQVSITLLEIHPALAANSNITVTPIPDNCFYSTSTKTRSYSDVLSCSIKYSGVNDSAPQGFYIKTRIEDLNNSARYFESNRYYPVVCSE